MRAALLAIALFVTSGPALAADFSDPDWPCVQRKVPKLWVGQMWSGPPIEEQDLKGWRDVPDVAALAPVLAVRRTSDAEAETLVSDFADNAGEARADKLRLVFAGAFTLISRERSEIIGGIGRYARTQTALSQAIEATQNQLTELQAIENPDFDTQDRIEEIEDKLIWDTRIYKDRQQSLTYVCETPVILEKRAFALARMIMGKLE
ncbi:MAG: hypothetical protein AAFN27_17580 [Pseudomonadota bacterium]